MPVLYVVLSNREEVVEPLGQAISESFPGNFYPIERGKWLVVAEGTAREISDRIGITSDPHKVPSGMVFAASGYYGRASSEVWEWIAAKLGGHIGA
jgi:hypothetical protein